jgi:hypothetical protein
VKVCKDTAHIANSLDEGAMLWHERLGHLNMARFQELDAMVDGMNLRAMPLHHVCEACIEDKCQRTSFHKYEATRNSKLLKLVHSDVCGPHLVVEHDTLSPSSTTFQEKFMFTF